MTTTTGAPVRVLVLDDQDAYRRVVADVVGETAGFALCGSTGCPADLFQLLEQSRPQLLLLDVRMPDADGLDISLRVRTTRPDIAVVLLSACTVDDIPSEVFAAGVGFLPKMDLSPATLVQAWAAVIGS